MRKKATFFVVAVPNIFFFRLVDGQQVNLATVEQLLSTYNSSTKVKLSLQRPSKIFAAAAAANDSSNSTSQDDETTAGGGQPPAAAALLKVLTGEGPSAGEVMARLKRFPYLVLYTTREGITEASPEHADILYQFPTPALMGPLSAALLKVRGLFSTLCQALPEVTGGSRPLASSVRVGSGQQLVHVAYAEEREDVFLLALPASKCSAKEVCQVRRRKKKKYSRV